MEKSLRREYGMALVIVIISAVACLIYWRSALESQDRLIADTRQTVERRAVQLNAAVSQEVDAMVRQIDLATQYLRDAYVHERAFDAVAHQMRQSLPAGVVHTHQSTFDTMAQLTLQSFPAGALSFITVFDEQGTLAYSSNGLTDAGEKRYFGDRDYFRVHAESQDDRLFISKPILGQLTGVWLVQFSRPIRQDGRLVGVVGIPVRPDYLSTTLARVLLNPQDVVAIVHTDGHFIARTHHLEQALQMQAPADLPYLQAESGSNGVFRAVSTVDRVPLTFAWRRLEHWPLITAVSLDEDIELAPVYAQIAVECWRAGIASALLLAFALGLASIADGVIKCCSAPPATVSISLTSTAICARPAIRSGG